MPLDAYRPRFHFTAPHGWINDPNGLIQVDGVYHLFYQFHDDPCPTDWWRKLWGHATSRNLVTWRDEPVALRPGASTGDTDGCWSGCAVEAGEEVRLYYTGVTEEKQQHLCVARADRALREIKVQPFKLPVTGIDFPRGQTFRDPYVWREGAQWGALIAGAMPGGNSTEGAMELSSDDGLSWQPVRQKIVSRSGTNIILECPNRLLLDGREVLLASAQPFWAPIYCVGGEADTHTLESMSLLMSGSRFYAPLVFRDGRGRCLMFGYCEEARDFTSITADGWCNTLSLPIELRLGANDQLMCRPVEELRHLRRGTMASATGAALREQPLVVENLTGNQGEFELEFATGNAATLFVDVLVNPAGEEFTRIVFDAKTGGVEIDTSNSSMAGFAANQGGNDRQGPRKADWRFAPWECRVTLRIFVDRSIVDVFTDAGAFATQRAYPAQAASIGVRVSAQGSGARLVRAEGWTLGAILEERNG